MVIEIMIKRDAEHDVDDGCGDDAYQITLIIKNAKGVPL